MSSISSIAFAMLQANDDGASISEIAARLQVPETWVAERVEAARLCLVLTKSLDDGDSDGPAPSDVRTLRQPRQSFRVHRGR